MIALTSWPGWRSRLPLVAGAAGVVTVLGAMALGTSGAALPVVAVLALITLALVIAALADGSRGWRRATLAARADHQGHPADAAARESMLHALEQIRAHADDPAAVAALAARQEATLRGAPSADEELLAALTHVARDVERAHPGVTVDVTALDEAVTEPAPPVLLDAVRDAITDAARHAGPRVQVQAECDDDEVTVWVSDAGPGFAPGDAPAERRDALDRVRARVEGAGGEVVVASTRSGTEVMMSVPRRTAP